MNVVAPAQAAAPIYYVYKTGGETAWYASADWWMVLVTAVLTAATIFLGVFTYKLWVATRNAGVEAQQTLDLADREFTATFRPAILIRNIVIHPDAGQDLFVKPFAGRQEQFSGQFYIENVGTGDALIKEAFFGLYALQGFLPMRRPYEGLDGNSAVTTRAVKAGESATILFNTSLLYGHHGKDEPDISPRLFKTKNYLLYAMGWISFADRSGSLRRVNFCRLFDDDRARFQPLDPPVPDYES